MITSGYSALAGFIGVLQFVAGAAAIGVGVRNVLLGRVDQADAADRLESSTYLAALLAYLLLGLSLASWIVLYLMLDSFVPQWPGAMCIYGVTLIGEGSRGVYGWLPKLVVLLQFLKPVLVFAIGAALVLYRSYRLQGTRVLLPRIALLLLMAGIVASLDAATELAYVSIPKREDMPNSGCCSVSAIGPGTPMTLGPQEQQQLSIAYYVCQLVIVTMLWRQARQPGRPAAWSLLALSLAAIVTLWVSMRFLVDVASPILLHLPYHRCLYDLVQKVPESGLAIGLLLWGTFCVGWTCVLAWLGRQTTPADEVGRDQRACERRPTNSDVDDSVGNALRGVPGQADGFSPAPTTERHGVRSLQSEEAFFPEVLAAELRGWPAYALVGYLGSFVMISLELWLA
ncbi:MAG: hypothetical protein B7Z73_16490 [Planctomycetia bacterium 21-64-5]|nr:MAG: hypothetical protein B7Z73_16490 [Planctomycetia bacterium 21-64-5]HQU44504.1 hypothetical protein [Pirellulales bacterium]